MKSQDTGLFNVDKNDILSFLKQAVTSFMLCSLLCTFILCLYGAVVFSDHARLLGMFRGIIMERAERDLKGIFNGYFYWSEMVNRSKNGDTPFIDDQLEELREEYTVAGLSIYQNGEIIYSSGVDFTASVEKVDYRVGGDKKLLAGRSYFMINDDDETQTDLSYCLWLDISDEIKKLRPFMFSFELTSQLDGVSGGESFLGNTRIKMGFFAFIMNLMKREPWVPVSVFAMSVLVYLLIWLVIQKHSMELSWSERLRSLTGILEEKDAYTYGHGHRVAEYSVSIARGLGLKEKEVKNINLAAQCHDLGKIFVPDEILNKRGPLTPAEFSHIKKHPVDSERIFLNLIKDVKVGKTIRHHHERWDGGGYPDGFRGFDIPYDSRIIAIADSFDAMTSQRPYRMAMPLERALHLLAENSGTQFDPSLVSVSIRILSQVYKEEKAFTLNYRSEPEGVSLFKEIFSKH